MIMLSLYCANIGPLDKTLLAQNWLASDQFPLFVLTERGTSINDLPAETLCTFSHKMQLQAGKAIANLCSTVGLTIMQNMVFCVTN